MAIWLVKRSTDDGTAEIDGVNSAIVEAANAGAARTAADALDARFTGYTPTYFAAASADDLEAAAYLGGTFSTIVDLGF